MARGIYDPVGFQKGGFSNFRAEVLEASWVDDFDYGGTRRDEPSLAVRLKLQIVGGLGDGKTTIQHWGAGDPSRFEIIKNGTHIRPASSDVKGLSADSNAGRFFTYLFDKTKCKGALNVDKYGDKPIEFLEGLTITFAGVDFPGLKRAVPMPVAIGAAEPNEQTGDDQDDADEDNEDNPAKDEDDEEEDNPESLATTALTALTKKGPVKVGRIAIEVFKALADHDRATRQKAARIAASPAFLKAWKIKAGAVVGSA